MSSISRNKFLTQISLSAAAAIAFPKLGYSSSGYFANHTIAEEFVEVGELHHLSIEFDVEIVLVLR